MANTLDLTAIASLGSIITLTIYLLVNVGHLRVIGETGANRMMVLLASAGCLLALVLFLIHVLATAPVTAALLLVFAVLAFGGEVLLQRLRGRKIQPRHVHRRVADVAR